LNKWVLPFFLYLKSALIACVNLIIAITHTAIHAIMAVSYAYLSAVWAGSENPVWPHLVLVPLSAIAGIAVGAGIIFERSKYSEKVQLIAFWLVVLGVAIESVCTIGLFVVDERISGAQQSKIGAQNREIIELEKRIAPREINKDERAIIADLLRPFGAIPFDLCITPGVEDSFIHDIENTLAMAGWVVQNFGGNDATPEQLKVPPGNDPGIGVCGLTGVRIVIDSSHESQFDKPAATLRAALWALGMAADAGAITGDHMMRPEIMHIQIGIRL
jgi:hypothetical protein